MPADPHQVVADLAARLLDQLAGLDRPLRHCHGVGGLGCLIQVWPGGGRLPVADAPPAATTRAAASDRRAKCRSDILDTIRAVGHALTRKKLISELKKAGTPHGGGTVAKALAELTRAGELVNRKDKHGYRLPEWPKPSPTPSLFD